MTKFCYLERTLEYYNKKSKEPSRILSPFVQPYAIDLYTIQSSDSL